MIKLNIEGDQPSKQPIILFEYQIFYSLLQMKASACKNNNQNILDRINEFKSNLTLFKPLFDEFLST